MADKPTYEELKARIKELNQIVDECKLTVEALKESEERYRTLHENVPVGVYRASSSGKLLSANPAAVKIFGFDPEEDLLSYHVTNLFKEPEKREAALKQLKTEGQIKDFEAEFKRKDGSSFWGSISATLVADKDGNFVFYNAIIQDITERKHAEEKFLQEKAFTDAIIKSMPGSFYLYDENQRLIRWNENFEILSGYSAEELFHKSPADFFEGEDIKKVSRSLEQVLNNGKATVEADVRIKDGTKTPYFMTGSLLTQNDKNYMLGVAIDITERMQIEETLRKSEQRFRSLVANIPGAVYRCDKDPDWTMRHLSDSIADICSYPASDFIGNRVRTFTSIIHPDDRNMVDNAVEKSVESGQSFTIEYRLHDADGKQRWVYESGMGVFGEDGRVQYLDGAIFDITERKIAEEALRESEEKYRHLVENIPSVTWVTSEHGETKFISPNVEKIYGFRQEEVYKGGESLWFGRIHRNDREFVRHSFELMFDKDQKFDVEYRIQRKDGEWIWIHDMAIIAFEKDNIRYAHGVFSDITERKRAEEARRSSERNYREVFNATSDAIFVHDGETGKILDVNKTALDKFGYSYEDLLGLTVEDLSSEEPPFSQQEAFRRIRKAVEEGPQVFDWKCKKKSGEQFWTSVSLKSSQIGGKGRILAAIRDITDRKEAEERLRESESRYRSLFESANDAIIIIKDVVFMDCNRKALEMFGCTREQIIGKPPYTFSPIDQPDGSVSRKKALEKIKAAYEGEPQIFEWRHTKYDGTPFDAQVSLNLVELSTGIHLQAIVRDITEKKSQDKQIRLMQHWVEQSVDLFFWVREDSRILYVNQAVCHSLGYTKEEFRTMKVSDFDLDLPLEAWPDFAQKLREQGSHCFETRLRKKNGQVFPVEITANILNFEGKVHFFAYGRDSSAKVSAEEKRKELEKQLRQAQKMEAIGTLAGGIAHDFNNILSAIIGFTEISIRDVPPGSKLEHNLQRVHNAGIRAGDLVKQILTFSRQTDREIKPVQVKPIVMEALKLIRASLPATIEIHQDIRSDSTVMADPIQVHQIIMNLTTNAAHAMQDTGGTMVVSLTDVEPGADVTDPHPDMAPGPFIKLTVSDSGHGMAPEIKDRIFDPFFTTKELGEGTGLGLSVVHGIVKDCGGMVSVENSPGAGSTFHVFFPVIKSKHDAEIVTRTPLPTGTERILFVDDEESQVEMGKQVLGLLSYRVTAKTNSREALKVFRAKPDEFDLVITDMTMPKMTGDVLAKEIMAIRSDVPVILCTGYSEKITPAKAKALGIKEVVMKPAGVEEIARTVRRVLDKTIED